MILKFNGDEHDKPQEEENGNEEVLEILVENVSVDEISGEVTLQNQECRCGTIIMGLLYILKPNSIAKIKCRDNKVFLLEYSGGKKYSFNKEVAE